MATQTDIINLALFKLAQDQTIPTIADQSKAARVFNRLWDPTVDLVLSDGMWPWAMKAQALALGVDPTEQGWLYRYSRPNDCLTAWAVTNVDGLRDARSYGGLPCFTGQWPGMFGPFKADFDQCHGTTETEILTDLEDAYLVYTVRVTDPGRFPAHFVDALASRLAADGAGAMIGEVGLNAKPRLMQEYTLARSLAATHDYNEASNSREPATPMLMARS